MEKEKTKITVGTIGKGVLYILSWIFGILFIIMGAGIMALSPFWGVVIIICAAMLIPYFDTLIAKKFNVEISGGVKFILVIVIFVAMGFGFQATDTTIQTQSTNESTQEAETPSQQEVETKTTTQTTEKQVEAHYLKEPVQIGSFEYTINSYYTTSAIGQDLMGTFMGETADGVFLVVDVTIENIGTESITMWDSMIKIVDDQERTYSHDMNAEIYLSMANQKAFTFEQLQPGLPKRGYIVFDVPSDLKGYFEVSSTNIFSSDKKYIAFFERP